MVSTSSAYLATLNGCLRSAIEDAKAMGDYDEDVLRSEREFGVI